jgi:glycerol-3-phosphate acyltransferase PlsX
MGGDHAPSEIVAGAIEAARSGQRVLLVGPEQRLRALVPKGLPIGIVNAEAVVSMEDRPTRALRGDKPTSIRVALELVRDGRACGVVSCGNSGAVVVASKIVLGTYEGVDRPAITTILPRQDGGKLVLLDAGANVDCRPEQLVCFALLGAAYATVQGIEEPRVGILSNGSEPGKGNMLVRATLPLLEAIPINLVGPIEPTQAMAGACDVLVCDGFAGNVFLKSAEAAADTVSKLLKLEIGRRNSGRLGAWLMGPALLRLQRHVNWDAHGGAMLLGTRGHVVIGHGRAKAEAVRAAIEMVHAGARRGLVEEIELKLSLNQ